MHRQPPAAQRGWVGLIVILVALVIVEVLAKEALKQYGLVSGAPAATKAGTPAERVRAPGAAGGEAPDRGAPATPASALERARGVEEMMMRQADERAARDDATAK